MMDITNRISNQFASFNKNKRLKEAILEQFEPDVIGPLLEYGKHLSTIKADYLVFMARKSLCLYDVLQALGAAPVETSVISDRALDTRMDALTGKRVALIDDCIIVGTTLAKTKRSLEVESAVQVTTHAFCVDNKWWNPKLIEPTKVFLSLSDVRVMTFCTSVVRSLSILPRPYLVDFPLSLPTIIESSDLPRLFSAVEWVSANLTTELQETHDAGVFGFFPTDDVCCDMARGLGNEVFSCIEICKVRAFARKIGGTYSISFVPLVTVKPMREKDIGILLRSLIDTIGSYAGAKLSRIIEFVQMPVAQHRLVQYILSCVLGGYAERALSGSLGLDIKIEYDTVETDRCFGPWLHTETSILTQYSFSAFCLGSERTIVPAHLGVAPVSAPESVKVWADGLLQSAHAPAQSDLQPALNLDKVDELKCVTDFTELFLKIYEDLEIPAREEARKLGERLLDASPEHTPCRDRLEIGLPWRSIVDHIADRNVLNSSPQTDNFVSLILDHANDLGISVPITCVRDGIVFRAYRHGEDVKFSDGELALAYDMFQGYLDKSHQASISKLVLEKMLVLMIQIGHKKGFLKPYYGPTGGEGTAQIGFSLKGAVPVLTRDEPRYPDRDLWLSAYLLERQVIRLSEHGTYVLGKRVSGNYVRSDAPDDVYTLGSIMGWLICPPDSAERQSPLDDAALIVLATCWSPRNVLGALQAELAFLRRWYFEGGKENLRTVTWHDLESVNKTYKSLLASNGYEAVHSARLKYVAYRQEEPRRIVDECTKFLGHALPFDIPARQWASYWNMLGTKESVSERKALHRPLSKAASLLWEAGICIGGLELSLRARFRMFPKRRRTSLQSNEAKWRSFISATEAFGLSDSPLLASFNSCIEQIKQDATNPDQIKSLYDEFLALLDERMRSSAVLIDLINNAIVKASRTAERQDYSYFFYYDIIDSRSRSTVPEGRENETNRKNLSLFRQFASKAISRLTNIAAENEGQIYCVNGTVDSENDGKHIFLTGDSSREYLTQLIEVLLENTTVLDLKIRMGLLPCNAFNSPVYRFENEVEVTGATFW